MTLGDHQAAFTVDWAKLVLWVNGNERLPGYRLRMAECLRHRLMQQHYFANGATSSPDRSQHLVALAMDANLDIDGVWQTTTEAHAPMGWYWERLSIHNRWGGRFSGGDGNHYERMLTPRIGSELPRWA